MVKDISENEFDAAVSSGVSIVDFWAQWCGPCKMQGAILDRFAETHPEVSILKVDIDSNMDLAGRFGIMSIPAVRVFKDGEIVASFDGVTKAEEIAAAAGIAAGAGE